MSGIKNFNQESFTIAAHYLRNLGYFVFSPTERDIERYGPDILQSETGNIADAIAKGFDFREALAADLKWICEEAEAMYMLKGWEQSSGAFSEWATARALKLAMLYQ